MSRKLVWLLCLGGLTLGIGIGVGGGIFLSTSHRSPYTEQINSPVRGLSAQEVDDLLQGRGAGYARMAELNSFPGPRHVLDLKQDLALSTEQEQAIQTVFNAMQGRAQQLGETIVEQETQLSQSFAMEKIAPEALDQQTAELASLYGELRATHLQAHLEITPLLSDSQIERYDQLRGYVDTSTHDQHTH